MAALLGSGIQLSKDEAKKFFKKVDASGDDVVDYKVLYSLYCRLSLQNNSVHPTLSTVLSYNPSITYCTLCNTFSQEFVKWKTGDYFSRLPDHE